MGYWQKHRAPLYLCISYQDISTRAATSQLLLLEQNLTGLTLMWLRSGTRRISEEALEAGASEGLGKAVPQGRSSTPLSLYH
jgi:hypothetical protein